MAKVGRPRKLPLEVEAQKFLEERHKDSPTRRDVYVAAVLSGLIAKSNARPEELLNEAEAWADIILKED